MKYLIFIFCAILISVSVKSQKFYIDPLNGSADGNGSFDHPWKTLQEVIEQNLIESYEPVNYPYDGTGELKLKNVAAPVSGGDTLILRTGYHGNINLLRYFNRDTIFVMAEKDNFPTLARLKLTAGKNWKFAGLNVSPEFAEEYTRDNIFRLESHNWSGPVSDVVIENCIGWSVDDPSGWSAKDWDTLACTGISCNASNVELLNNILRNVNFGISVSGNNCVISNNSIINFSGDGLRGLGNDLIFEYNTVKNCYDVNENHDDGFQSWATNGEGPERITLRGNTIINYEDPDQPFRGTLQGIGLFDGPYIDWIIENNVIMVDHWHGISIYGGINCRVVNNTVVDLNDVSPGPPWIRVADQKDSTHSINCIVRNNLATSFTIGEGVTADHNIKIKNYDEYFVNYVNHNLHLKTGCPAIDSGYAVFAPLTDIEGIARPQGNAVDIGAYEYSDPAKVNRQNFIPDEFALFQNYPNPFNPETTIEFFIPGNRDFYSTPLKTTLIVYDLLGKKISTLVDRYEMQGRHIVKFNASSLSGGIYFYRLTAGSFSQTKKLIVLK